MQDTLQTQISRLLEDAEQSAQEGKREQAYQSSLTATNLAPHEPLAWYLRSQTAPSPEEQLICLSRVYSLSPDFPPAKGEMYMALKDLIKQEPTLVYLDETKDLYQVKWGRDLLINIPKNRVYEELYLKRKISPLQPAFVWLNMSILALLFGGVGAFFLAPIAAINAAQQWGAQLKRPDQVRLFVVLFLSAIVWLTSIPLSLLFLVHLMN